MNRTLEEIEAEVVGLPEPSRMRLVGSLLASLDAGATAEDPIALAWIEEALRRDAESERGEEPDLPADEVFLRLESRGG